jgi:hypothetical protein
MALNIERELAALRRMTPKELQERYAEVFSEQPRSRNRQWLTKRIAWRLQAMEEGDLSERARRRAMELANDADLRTTAPRNGQSPVTDPGRTATAAFTADDRLPMPGTLLTRQYRGRTIQVLVLPNGFQFDGQVYRSLSAVAKAVTGSHWNGYHFFGLRQEEAA